MDYEDLLRWYYSAALCPEYNNAEAYQFVKEWALTNGHCVSDIINTLCDDSMSLLNYKFIIY